MLIKCLMLQTEIDLNDLRVRVCGLNFTVRPDRLHVSLRLTDSDRGRVVQHSVHNFLTVRLYSSSSITHFSEFGRRIAVLSIFRKASNQVSLIGRTLASFGNHNISSPNSRNQTHVRCRKVPKIETMKKCDRISCFDST